MATLDVNGQLVGYAVEGPADLDVPWVLLLHGTTMNRTAWDGVRAALPADHPRRIVMVEFPGSGESAMPSGPLDVDSLVDQAHAVMTHLGAISYHVAGYSLGAVVAAALAAAHPVRSATLLCGWAETDARMRVTFDLWKRLIVADPELFMRYAVADGYTPATIAALEPMLDGVATMGTAAIAPGSAAHLDLDMRVNISDRLGAITAPTLVIGATDDRWVDIRHSRQLAQAIAAARLEELPAGHLVIQEQAAAIAALLAAHIVDAA